jgi:hypothetical protein
VGIENAVLDSYDISSHCYFDPSYPVGSAVAEMGVPNRQSWTLHQGSAIDAARTSLGTGVELVFIDADHMHPCPTIDALVLLPALASGAWLVLHDINLPNIPGGRDFPHYGALSLYDGWEYEKRRVGGELDNIGAIRLPPDPIDSRRNLLQVLAAPWQTRVAGDVLCAALDTRRPPNRPASVVAAIRASIDRSPIAVWGAGSAGRRLLADLHTNGVRVVAVIDRDPKKHGGDIDGVRVVAPEWLQNRGADNEKIFIVVSTMLHREITPVLAHMGYIQDRDFVVDDALLM